MRPKLVPVPERMQGRLGAGLLLIPTALEVDTAIRKAQPGEVITVSRIRRRLAIWHNADVTCPLVTGIFVRIAAEASEEDRQAGREAITPWWRVVGDDGKLNPRFPGGVERQASLLRAEGMKIVKDKVILPEEPRSGG